MVQRYGPGSTTRVIESYITAFESSFVRIGNLLNQSEEHTILSTLYNYYKLLNIAIVFSPVNQQVGMPPFLMQMNWNQDEDIEKIQYEDNSKVVPSYRTRRYFYKFIPPNITFLVGEPNANPPKLSVVNMMEYIRTYIPATYIPGRIIFDKSVSTQTFTQSARVLIKIEYRGSKLPTSTTLKALANRFDTAQNEKVTEMGVKLGKMNQLEECYKKLSLEDKDEECSEYDGDDEFIEEMKNQDKEKETQK
jgi:hypothetical protein